MLRAILACVAFTYCAFAHRIQHLEEDVIILDSGVQSKSQNKFGASCDDLESMFHDRVVAFQAALDAGASQMRLTMRSYGIVRTMRRAQSCSWLVEGDSVDLDQMRDIVQTLLAENPCADAARAELEAGASFELSEIEAQSLQRSMSILLSESCEVVEVSTAEAVEDFEADVGEAEATLQDGIDEFVDGEGESSFIQSNDGSPTRRFFRGLGVAFLLLFLLLACAGTAAAIGAAIGYALLVLAVTLPIGFNPSGWDGLAYLIMAVYGGGFFGGVGGLAGCSYQLYTQLLPRLQN